MAAGYVINGNSLVLVGGSELGLSKDPIALEPNLYHTDVHADDFGPSAPAAVLWDLADFTIRMTLVWFDNAVLNDVLKASMGGGTLGTFQGAGALITGVTMEIQSDIAENPWSWPQAYLAQRPYVFSLGNEYSAVQLVWRAVGLPTAAAEVLSQGVRLWSNE